MTASAEDGYGNILTRSKMLHMIKKAIEEKCLLFMSNVFLVRAKI